jgi:hypothetical protein
MLTQEQFRMPTSEFSLGAFLPNLGVSDVAFTLSQLIATVIRTAALDVRGISPSACRYPVSHRLLPEVGLTMLVPFYIPGDLPRQNLQHNAYRTDQEEPAAPSDDQIPLSLGERI